MSVMQLYTILNSAINLYTMLIFVWVILSWFGNAKGFIRDIYKVLDTIVGPYVRLFKRFIPPMGGMDFSPLAALIVMQIFRTILVNILLA